MVDGSDLKRSGGRGGCCHDGMLLFLVDGSVLQIVSGGDGVCSYVSMLLSLWFVFLPFLTSGRLF